MICREKKILFIDIVRTGTTSIRAVLQASAGGQGQHHHLDNGTATREPPLASRLVGRRELRSMFVFTVVRNPWDRLVSLYEYGQQIASRGKRPPARYRMPFAEFAADVLAQDNPDLATKPMVDWYCFDGESQAHTVLRFERLTSDWARMAEQLSLPTHLPHLYGTRHRDYRDYYTEELAHDVGVFYRRDIDAHGYTFTLER